MGAAPRVLGGDRFTMDLFQLHGVIPTAYREVVARFYPEMERAREAGKVRFLGITERFFADPDYAMLPMALADDLFDTVMLKYGILNQTAARQVLPMAAACNVGTLILPPRKNAPGHGKL